VLCFYLEDGSRQAMIQQMKVITLGVTSSRTASTLVPITQDKHLRWYDSALSLTNMALVNAQLVAMEPIAAGYGLALICSAGVPDRFEANPCMEVQTLSLASKSVDEMDWLRNIFAEAALEQHCEDAVKWVAKTGFVEADAASGRAHEILHDLVKCLELRWYERWQLEKAMGITGTPDEPLGSDEQTVVWHLKRT